VFWLVSLIWTLGLFTDEYVLFLLPAFVVALAAWPWLKPVRLPLLISLTLLTVAGGYLFLAVLPGFISPDVKKPMARMSLTAWGDLGSLISRNAYYLVLNTWDNLSYTFGWTKPHYRFQLLPALVSGFLLAGITVMTRAWRGWARMILFWAVATLFAGGFLLPEGNGILHQITYYNRPLIALLMVVLGLFTDRVLNFRKAWPGFLWLSALVICALTSFFAVSVSIRFDPEEAYLTRYGLNDILQLHPRLRSGELAGPVFVAYPRFPDPVNGVYRELETAAFYTLENGFPWSLYRSVMPRLYLRHFEKGELRANPRQFARWSDSDEHEYRSASRSFYDMPAGVVFDLESIRSAAIFPPDISWLSDSRDLRWRALTRPTRALPAPIS